MDKTMPTASERIELVTPLGDELLFHGMHAHEEVSRLGEYQLDLLSRNKDVDRDKILGAKVAVKVRLRDDKVRYFNGFVTRFSAGPSLGRYSRYYAVVSPWLWFLTRTADCRIFQDKTVRQIVEEVFADHPQVADFVFELTETYRTWKYCVQYRETDFNFVSRLLEHEGIYYYYRHTDGHHTLVLTDSMDKHDPTPGYETLQFIAPQALVRPGTEFISVWDISREVQPGAYVHDDYDFERPSVDLITAKTLPRAYTPSNYEVYDYPGGYLQKPHGEHYAHVRIDEYGAAFEKAQATTNYRGVQVGARFTLEGHRVEKLNGDYLVVAATQMLESSQYESGDAAGSGSGFSCSFTALSCAQQFRPRRITPKPFVQGPQTAVVVGASGDEIHTDKYGRVKVQFHWDRRGKKDENSSCWIRVSHPWAGKGWGSVATPRVGQEVIVDFLEGDPDQPIITGRVYNEENQPPFGFPAGAVLSGIKSATHKGSGYNELSMDDTAGKEKITIHGQYDMNTTIEHDETHTVVGGNRSMAVKSGTNTEVIKGNASLTIQAGTRSVDVTGGDYTAAATGMVSLHGKGSGVIVTGTPNVDITGTSTLTITSPNIDVSNDLIKIHGTKIELVTAGGSIVLDGSGVTIHGAKIQSGADGNHEITGAKVALSGGSGSVELSGAGAAMSGSKVSVSGAGSTEITGAVVKIN
jgi:type VI secretion system secreted protein VgrG